MPLVFVLLFIVYAAVASITGGQRSATQEGYAQQAATVAGQMGWYHMQALRQCAKPAVCAAGIIAVTPPANGGNLSYTNSFVSGTDGATVVTTWKPTSRFASTTFGFAGLVGSALKDASTKSEVTGYSATSAYAGSWDATTQSVGGANNYQYAGSTGTNTVAVSQNFGGLSLVNGAPVLVTPLAQ